MWQRCAAVWMWLFGSMACEMPPDAALVPPPVEQAVKTPEATPQPTGPMVCGTHPPVDGPRDDELRSIAQRAKLEYPEAFVHIANTLHQKGTLPDCYLSKRGAEGVGWHRGDDLWKSRAGTAIGGDNFYNREGRLPRDGRYVEADIDYDGGRRGARRLVFDRDVKGSWKIWLTIDHYDSFIPLEAK